MATIAALTTSLVIGALLILVLLQRLDRAERGTQIESPVPWISNHVWSVVKSNPRRFASHPRAPHSVIGAQVLTASAEDLERVAKATIPQGCNLPPTGDLAENVTRLENTPGPITIKNPIWPQCCDRLATLINFQGTGYELENLESLAGPLDLSFLEYELRSWGSPQMDREKILERGWSEILQEMRTGHHTGQGLNIFQCRACGRLYVGSCQP